MHKTNLAEVFAERAPPPPLIAAEEYCALLERLLAEGAGYGKTKPVAAYLLRNLRLMSADSSEESEVEIKPLYLVMDLEEWPNEYGRSLALKDIWEQYITRMIGEQDMNAPDFNGSGLWTAKQSSFEEDYMRREDLDDNGKRVNLYDPDPDAYRLCLPVEKRITIPVQWGSYTIGKGGTLALRERDIPALAEALLAVRSGKTAIEEALYTKDRQGNSIARFDVYGMEPGFLENNYGHVTLKPETQSILTAFTCGSVLPEQKHKPPARHC